LGGFSVFEELLGEGDLAVGLRLRGRFMGGKRKAEGREGQKEGACVCCSCHASNPLYPGSGAEHSLTSSTIDTFFGKRQARWNLPAQGCQPTIRARHEQRRHRCTEVPAEGPSRCRRHG